MGGPHPNPTRKDHQAFCETEGWTLRTSATGKRGTHHVNYEFALPDGRILYTRISHPVDRTDYGPAIFAHILRDQLDVTADVFWACVKDGTIPDRGVPKPSAEAIPVGVIRALTREARIPETEVMGMTKAEAIQRLADFYTHGK
jgi:hypothetical protein